MFFVISCVDKPDSAEIRAANRGAHLDYLGSFNDQIVVAGPTTTDDASAMTGSVLILDFADRAICWAQCKVGHLHSESPI